MKRILITGATGNIGPEVIHYLTEGSADAEIYAAVRDIEQARPKFEAIPNLLFRAFDFENPATFSSAFGQIDVLFLLRPPHISQVDKVFRPLLLAARDSGIQQVVFLSVQGVEKSKVIPHNKLERLIRELGFSNIFVRPSYFMLNLTTTLLPEIVNSRSITLPAGKATFNWIDVKNIGEASAVLLLSFEKYRNRSYELTGTENKNFADVAKLMAEVTGERITYRSMNPLCFYLKKKREGMTGGFAAVMTILHFLPRFQPEPQISDNYTQLTGKQPTTLAAFMVRENEKLTSPLQHQY